MGVWGIQVVEAAMVVAPGGGAVAPDGLVLIALESLSLSLSGLFEGSLDQSARVCSEMSVRGDPNGDPLCGGRVGVSAEMFACFLVVCLEYEKFNDDAH